MHVTEAEPDPPRLATPTADKDNSLGGTFTDGLTREELEELLFNGDLSAEEEDYDDTHLDGWQIPPHRPKRLDPGGTWFRYCWDGPGQLLIRHDKEPGAVYVLPIKAEGSTPMPVTPLIKPSVVYNYDYKAYQKLRDAQKKNPGRSGRQHGHRGKNRKKKEQEISESAERRTHNPVTTTESPQHTPTSTPKDNPSPLSGDPPLLRLSSPLLSVAWSKRVVHIPDEYDHLRPGPFKYYNRVFTSADLEAMEAELIERPPKQAPADGWFLIPVESSNSPVWARKSYKDSIHLETQGLAYHVIRSPTVLGSAIVKHVHGLIMHALDGDGASHEGIMGYMSNKGRLSYKAKHLGLSCHYGADTNFDPELKNPALRVSKDTMAQTGCNGKAEARSDAVKRVLFVIQKHLAPEIAQYLQYIDPLAFQFAQATRQRVLAFQGENVKKWALDFGGMFYCVALGKGHSFKIHIDTTDWCKSYAVVVPFGDFDSGDLVLPSRGVAIAVKSGQFVAVTASFLCHFISTTRGLRYAATFFTDQYIACKMRDVLVQMGFSTCDLNFEP